MTMKLHEAKKNSGRYGRDPETGEEGPAGD